MSDTMIQLNEETLNALLELTLWDFTIPPS